MKILDKNGNEVEYLIEVKPFKHTLPPKLSSTGKKTRRFIIEEMTYKENAAKWAAAKEFAEDRGWKFVVWTERELGIKR